MAMIGDRDKPTYYKILNSAGEVVGTYSKSKVLSEKRRLEQQTGEPHTVELAS